MPEEKKRERLKDFPVEVVRRAKDLRIIDDALWRLIAERPGVCQEILRTLLNDPKLVVMSTVAQYTEKSLYREITLDAKCVTSDGIICNIEMQKGNSNDDIRRVRFHASVLTANNTPKGADFKDVPDVKVLYITEYDALKIGKAVVHVSRCVDDGNGYHPLNEGEDIIFANTEAPGTDQETHLLKLFLRKDAFYDEMYPELSEAIKYFKETEGGIVTVCKSVQEYAEGFAQKREEEQLHEIIKSMLLDGEFSFEKIARLCHTSVEHVEKVQKELEMIPV